MKKSAFTLIELSIVLVIIGLIVGGVLVGQDLIKAAEIRATIGQIEKYDTAVHTFKVKYGYVPGDMPPATAGELGFFQLAACTTLCRYNNGVIDFSVAAGGNPSEEFIFWRHLSDAKLVDGSYGNNATYPFDSYGALTPFPDDWMTFLTPQTKMKGYSIRQADITPQDHIQARPSAIIC